jgi:hypothetical protein
MWTSSISHYKLINQYSRLNILHWECKCFPFQYYLPKGWKESEVLGLNPSFVIFWQLNPHFHPFCWLRPSSDFFSSTSTYLLQHTQNKSFPKSFYQFYFYSCLHQQNCMMPEVQNHVLYDFYSQKGLSVCWPGGGAQCKFIDRLIN